MSYTLKITPNGDFEKGSFNEFLTVTGIDLLRQHVKETVLEVSTIDDVARLEVNDKLMNIVESMLALRFSTGLRALRNILALRSVVRNPDEQVGKIDAVVVIKSKDDKRVFKFWIQVFSVGNNTAEITGGINV